MSKMKLKQLFELAEQVYIQELKKSSIAVLPFAWVYNAETGGLLIFSSFGVPSARIAEQLGIYLPPKEYRNRAALLAVQAEKQG